MEGGCCGEVVGGREVRGGCMHVLRLLRLLRSHALRPSLSRKVLTRTRMAA